MTIRDGVPTRSLCFKLPSLSLFGLLVESVSNVAITDQLRRLQCKGIVQIVNKTAHLEKRKTRRVKERGKKEPDRKKTAETRRCALLSSYPSSNRWETKHFLRPSQEFQLLALLLAPPSFSIKSLVKQGEWESPKLYSKRSLQPTHLCHISSSSFSLSKCQLL